MRDLDQSYVPHTGWFAHERDDEVARFLREGWFEYREQAFLWLYLRPGDVFLDCGAHFGLYSVLAGRAMANQGFVLAVEPHPRTIPLLKRNLKRSAARCVAVAPCALFARQGSVRFYPREASKAAYSALAPQTPEEAGIEVPATTLDALCESHGWKTVPLVKLDVEGAELDVLRGAERSLAAGLFPLWLVEFTEANQRNFRHQSKDLFDELESRGYTVCRWDDQTGELVALRYTGPVWHENYFAARHPEAVNQRLREAPRRHRAIARDILNRGAACNPLRLEEAVRRADEANQRAAEALQLLEASYRSNGEANWRTDEANQRAAEALQLLEASYRSNGEANWRAEEANRRAGEALRLLEEAYRRVDEATWRADDAHRRAEPAHQAWRQAAESVATLQARLSELLSSRYLRLGWKLGFCKRPDWIGQPDTTPPILPEPGLRPGPQS